MSTRNIILLIVFAMIALLLISGCISKQELVKSSERKEPIKIGLIAPLTGPAATYGQAAKQAIELAILKINSEGAINGRQLDVVLEDDAFDTKQAISAFQKLNSIDNVDFILTITSGETLALCPLAEQNKVILFTIATSPDVTTRCGDFTFRTLPSDIYQGAVLADKISLKLMKKVALLNINTAYGKGLADVFKNKFKDEIVATETFNRGDVDLKTQLSKIKSADPDAIVFIPETVEEMILFLKQKSESGLNIPVFGSESMKNKELLSKVNSDELGDLYVVFVSSYVGSEAQEFISKYKDAYVSEPGPFAEYYYDNVLAIAAAMKTCENVSSECVKNKLYALNYTGATGKIQFDSNGDLINKPYSLYKAGESEFVEVS